jgi:hypothetical protein
MTPGTKKEDVTLSGFPAWFGAIFATTYLSGFLIDYFYFSSKGIIDTGSEILKLHYVHIGSEFLIGTALIVGPVFYMLFVREQLNKQSTRSTPFSRVNLVLIATAFLYWWSLYIAAVFAPPHYFNRDEHWWRYLALVVIALSFVAYILGARRLLRDDPQYEAKRMAIGATLLIAISCLAAVVFWGLVEKVLTMLPGVIFYLGFCIGLAAVIARTYEMLSASEHWNLRTMTFFALSSCTFMVLLFLTLLSYTYSVYPYIPYTKGGADFSDAHRVSVVTDKEVLPTNTKLDDVIIIYSTSNSIFFAKPEKGNDACDWRRASANFGFVQVRREQVKSITLGPEKPNCFP